MDKSEAKPGQHLRRVRFTLNNFEPEDVDRLYKEPRISYLIYGVEIAPTTGTYHLQGYAELTGSYIFTTIKQIIGVRAWLGVAHRSLEENQAYCSKEGQVVERGKPRNQGHRGDLDMVRRVAAEEGMRAVVSDQRFNLQAVKLAEVYLKYAEDVRTEAPKVIWLWGATGKGKSHRAAELGEGMSCFWKGDGSKFFPGYDNHDVVVLNDYRSSWFSDPTLGGAWSYLLNLTDKWPMTVYTFNNTRQWRPQMVVITTPRSPHETWGHIGEDINQLLRRLTLVECLDQK